MCVCVYTYVYMCVHIHIYIVYIYMASQVVLVIKNLPANIGDVRDKGSLPGLGRSPVEGHGNSLQYSCLKNPMDREPCKLQSMGLQRVVHD